MRAAVLLCAACVASVGVACGGGPPSFVEYPPAGGPVVPLTLVVRNPSADAARLTIREGDLDAFGVFALDRPLGFLSLEDPTAACVCRCGEAGGCLRCEPLPPRVLDIPAGGEREFAWTGALLRSRRDGRGEWCGERVAPPPGRYRISVDAGDRVGAADVTLPAPGPVVVTLGPVVPLACPPADEQERRVRAALAWLSDHGADPSGLADCRPADATCLSPDAAVADPVPRTCRLAYVPHARTWEVRAVVGGPNGPVRWSLEHEGYASRIVRVELPR